MRFVEVDEARAASGVRLVVPAGVPSPWSEAAKGILAVKGIDSLLVRFFAPTGDAIRQWTGWHNVPVLMVDAEPPRAHWGDILMATERLGGRVSLLPSDADDRARMIGLAHELLGEDGLVWSGRLLAIHRGITTEGREGFVLRVAQYLARKYGYAPEHIAPAKTRVLATLNRFATMLGGRAFVLGDGLTALDIYLATSLAPFAPLPEAVCKNMNPAIRQAFATADIEVTAAIPAVLLEHRDRIYSEHIGLPVEL